MTEIPRFLGVYSPDDLPEPQPDSYIYVRVPVRTYRFIYVRNLVRFLIFRPKLVEEYKGFVMRASGVTQDEKEN